MSFKEVYDSFSREETMALAKGLAQVAKPGQTFCLCGDLGTGKTVFSKGFAEGCGVPEKLTSPTFTLIHEYPEQKLYHFDLYRLETAEELLDIGWDDYLDAENICLVEWADLFREEMPPDAIWVYLEKDLEKGVNYRRIRVESV